ncbi:phosphatase PAP2 family protein [Actinocorallia populi]|uniref:phosphatase PAP2 family protein n=1 Tax=Actinocorallia populi TaxID=2079200 RepID=UPI000D08B823|nr:phosphatase PAP2 family protein [Actinocorallia populi]
MDQILSAIGSAGFYVPFLLVLSWCVSPLMGVRGLVMLMISGTLNELVKLWTAEPRPYWTDPSIDPGASVESFGMPSGHAQNAVVVWGVLAWTLGRRAAWTAAALLALGIGWSRYSLGVHSPGQILAGWAIGLALLAGAMAWERRLGRWWRAQTRAVRLITAVTPPLILLAATFLAARGLADDAFPRTWTEAVLREGGSELRISSDNAATGAGFLAGCLLGLVPRAGLPPLAPAAGPGRAVLRLLIGAGPLAVLGGAHLALVNFGTPYAPALFALAAAAGLWAVLGAPAVFRRAEPAMGEDKAHRRLPRPGERSDLPEP